MTHEVTYTRCKSHLHTMPCFPSKQQWQMNKCKWETTEPNKNVKELVPVSTSVFIAPRSHMFPMFVCVPPGMPRCRLSQCGVVLAVSGVHWGAAGCGAHKCQLPHLLPLIYWKWDVWGHRGYGMCFLYTCVCVRVCVCSGLQAFVPAWLTTVGSLLSLL